MLSGKMGAYGKKIFVYQNNGTQTLIYSFSGLNHVHVLEEPFTIEPDDVLQVLRGREGDTDRERERGKEIYKMLKRKLTERETE